MPQIQAEFGQVRGNMQTTYVMVKPDGVQRGLVGEIIQRFERKGLQLVGLNSVIPSKKLQGPIMRFTQKDHFPRTYQICNFWTGGVHGVERKKMLSLLLGI